MAFPAWAAAAIQGGASIGGTLMSGLMTQRANHDAQSYNTSMYWLQEEQERKKWLEQNRYNEDLWNKQNIYNEQVWHKMNEYNSPLKQMERYKEAGLNPNLIYGQMTSTPAIATSQQRTAPRGQGQYNAVAPPRYNFDLDTGLSAYTSFRESAARTDNLRAQNDVLKQEALNKAMDIANKGIANSRGQLELDTAKQLQRTSIDAAEASLRMQNLQYDLSLQKNEREAALNSSNLREAAQRILNMRGQQLNTSLDSRLKYLDYQLKSLGVQPTDNLFIRMLGRVINSPETKESANDFLNWFDSNWSKPQTP